MNSRNAAEFFQACQSDDIVQLKHLHNQLSIACEHQSEKAQKFLTNFCINKYGKNLLHESAQFCSVNCLEFLLENLKFSADVLKQGDWTPLMLACTKVQIFYMNKITDM